MNEPVNTAERQPPRQQGLLARLITLPFTLFGISMGALLLSVTIEWIGMYFFWPQQSWHHAQSMFRYELDQVSAQFIRSAIINDPVNTTASLMDSTYKWIFIKSGLIEWINKTSSQVEQSNGTDTHNLHQYFIQAYKTFEPFVMAAAFILLTSMVRILILVLTLPLFGITAFVGLVDGLARRDIRRFEAGRESGFIYHRSKALVGPLLILPWVIYLALLCNIDPLTILLPAAVAFGIAVDMTAASFKKYL